MDVHISMTSINMLLYKNFGKFSQILFILNEINWQLHFKEYKRLSWVNTWAKIQLKPVFKISTFSYLRLNFCSILLIKSSLIILVTIILHALISLTGWMWHHILLHLTSLKAEKTSRKTSQNASRSNQQPTGCSRITAQVRQWEGVMRWDRMNSGAEMA